MGFTQLLVANRGLRNIKDGPSRYKMTQANLLPKFGAEKDAREGGAAVVIGVAADVRLADRPLAPMEPLNQASSPAPVTEATARVGRTGPPKQPRSLFRNPFGGATRKLEPGLVQTELLLDGVKPVRNRLGEDEFEPARITRDAVRATATAPLAALVRPAETPGFWRRWRIRLFGAPRQT